MVSDSNGADLLRQVRQLSSALDAIEESLARLQPGADADAVAEALAGPVRALDAAAKEGSL